ncbi:hypothetical protein [Chroococcidiopsis sp. SAG 2025]|uniref:hypothetical protein n=1 Tax=Chroococcidiopsis sp. SAG 2025 TaxID=171389 RepID=UPI002936D64E|nr:hypothetical protein [Chroococcidiopsis sp. SAG 2025]
MQRKLGIRAIRFPKEVKNAQPQEEERIRTQEQAGEREYDSEGHFRVDKQARRLKWGSDSENLLRHSRSTAMPE